MLFHFPLQDNLKIRPGGTVSPVTMKTPDPTTRGSGTELTRRRFLRTTAAGGVLKGLG